MYINPPLHHIHTSIHPYIHTYIHTYIYTYIFINIYPPHTTIQQETVFNVGQHVEFRAEYTGQVKPTIPIQYLYLNPTIYILTPLYSMYTGQLICFANDAHSNYWNNYGDLQVLYIVCVLNPLYMYYNVY
ncbi:hypothetical protein B484DRAFT_271282 [Ochromonadaceae sp. CCMP2298]|nr:hypothetical protein B484DRAFT_271282 [Ochromonadaceae sp. CCMP2298]